MASQSRVIECAENFLKISADTRKRAYLIIQQLALQSQKIATGWGTDEDVYLRLILLLFDALDDTRPHDPAHKLILAIFGQTRHTKPCFTSIKYIEVPPNLLEFDDLSPTEEVIAHFEQ